MLFEVGVSSLNGSGRPAVCSHRVVRPCLDWTFCAKTKWMEPSRMLVVLEAAAGPIAARRIAVHAGSTLRIGRSAKSDYAIGEDSYLSSLHFSVECDGI